eukprot:GGOE01004004.1.p1 GENE.GGOE01004004.1~~GGOE01004004.1.p1  ORF type:complete len:484 (-),score=137.78 GGOE01004004.1:385-1728(-)
MGPVSTASTDAAQATSAPNTKRLHWAAINQPTDLTLFANGEAVEVDLSSIGDLFPSRPAAAATGTPSRRRSFTDSTPQLPARCRSASSRSVRDTRSESSPDAEAGSSLLQRQRKQNVEIVLLRQLRGLPPEQLSSLPDRMALQMPDTDGAITYIVPTGEWVMQREGIEALIKCLPTSEEAVSMRAFSDMPRLPNQFGMAERFVYEMCRIPRVAAKFKAVGFALEFSDNVQNVQRDLAVLSAAFAELEANTELHQLLNIILKVGNTMNTGTVRGNAKGFRLSLLPRLPHVKSTINPRVTLIHYLLSICPPRVAAWPQELKHLARAERLSLANAREFVRQMMMVLEQVVLMECVSCGEAEGETSVFLDRMRRFGHDARAKLTVLQGDLVAAEEQCARVMLFFGEDGTEMDLSTFLTTISGFRTAWLRALVDHNNGVQPLPDALHRRASC